jgi:hypothetical protein
VGRKFWILITAMLMGFVVFGIFFQLMFNARQSQNKSHLAVPTQQE